MANRVTDGVAYRRCGGLSSVWQLYGRGSVGSQSLTGIPGVDSLRNDSDLRDISQVGPFETGFLGRPGDGRRPYLLLVEIWPGIVESRARQFHSSNPNLPRDAAQVMAMCEYAADRDADAKNQNWFGVPRGLDADAVRQAVDEEGWILGV